MVMGKLYCVRTGSLFNLPGIHFGLILSTLIASSAVPYPMSLRFLISDREGVRRQTEVILKASFYAVGF